MGLDSLQVPGRGGARYIQRSWPGSEIKALQNLPLLIISGKLQVTDDVLQFDLLQGAAVQIREVLNALIQSQLSKCFCTRQAPPAFLFKK
jgi:hypothetical protein